MKYALIFVTSAAAYEGYGGYGAPKSSSTPTKPAGYATITPGYGKTPVTVTTQHQPYPTCVSAGYGGKDCEKWEEKPYVSTTIKDYDNHLCTVTDAYQPIVVYHTKTTITHEGTATPTAPGSYATPTGYANKNSTGCWYELYEKIVEVPYNQLGPHALPGYPGSGLYTEGDKVQPVHVKEYKGGKWTQHEDKYNYEAPKPQVTTYAAAGVYTVPSKYVTMSGSNVYHYPAQTVTVTKPGQAYTCSYEQVKQHQPTGTPYQGNGYPAQPTATPVHGNSYGTPNQPEGHGGYPSSPAPSTPAHGSSYGTPNQPEGHGEYPSTPAQGGSYGTPNKPEGYGGYPSTPAQSTPVHGGSYGGYPSSPVQSTPAQGGSYGTPNQPEGHGGYPSTPAQGGSYGTPNKPEGYGGHPSSSSQSAPAYGGAYPTPKQPEGHGEYPSYPAAQTSVHQNGYGSVPSSTPKLPENGYGGYPSYPTTTPPAGYPVTMVTVPKASSTPCTTSTVPTPTPVYPAQATSTPCDDDKPSATHAYPASPNPSSDYKEPAQGYGKTGPGYTKRGGLIQRRKAEVAKSNRAILL